MPKKIEAPEPHLPKRGYIIVGKYGYVYAPSFATNRHDSWQQLGCETPFDVKTWRRDGFRCIPVVLDKVK